MSSKNMKISRPWTPKDDDIEHGKKTNGHETNGTIDHTIPTETDVIVVGGGFSGLMAAYKVQKAGYKTILLEATSRIGGRSRSLLMRSGPGVVDMGATWINKITQPNIYALTQEFGLETKEQYTKGDAIFQGPDGIVTKRPDDVLFDVPDQSLAEKLQEAVMLLATTAEECNIHDFNSFPAEEDVSLADWLIQKGIGDEFIQLLCSHLTSAIFGCSQEEMGAHYFFDYIKSGCGLMSIVSEGEMGAKSLKLKKGTSSIAYSLAKAMTPDTILINTPVTSITQKPSLVTVKTANHTFSARKLIIAIPTNMYTSIAFSPPLSPPKHTVISNSKPGIYAKVVLTYQSPWWREDGLVGKVTSLVGPICFSWDVSDPELEQYSLAFFLAGNIAERWARDNPTEPEREQAVVEHLATLVGPRLEKKAKDVLEVHTVNWPEEEYIGGAPTSVQGPGMLRKFGKEWRAPFGNMHFAGGEYAYEWKGYLEGAVNAGQAAADQVVEALKSI